MKLRHGYDPADVTPCDQTERGVPRLLLQPARVALGRRLWAAAAAHLAMALLFMAAYRLEQSEPDVIQGEPVSVMVWIPDALPRGAGSRVLSTAQPPGLAPRPPAESVRRALDRPADTAAAAGVEAGPPDITADFPAGGTPGAGSTSTGSPRGIPMPWIELTPMAGSVTDLSRALFWVAVANRAAYPDEMFTLSPELPPCGLNLRASRTWIEIYDERAGRLYGHCAIDAPAGLARMGVTIPLRVGPTARIYIVMTDRLTGINYKSNVVEVQIGQSR